MKLKALEISGFKSFADKTKIEFMPGMTGIVRAKREWQKQYY
ncbi:hypothetical protein ACUKBL_11150 [Furfurilactobacillus rossiae]